MELISARSKHYFYNSMVCLLKALEGMEVTVELRNDMVLKGKLDFCESAMNLNMSDVTLTTVKGEQRFFPKFYCKGRFIHYVMIPDQIDITKAMQWQVNKTEYFKEKERKFQKKTFERLQGSRAKAAAKLTKQEQK
ncbi:unnamed protein product [Candidula unifasciata]|uniref:Sm domain-containing protein n=1 Tax=Candidula unifasciata TaxID=100452 RepID=A0A8S4A1U2_9EUPU|nr:unnamed protein product [Candidula unifasciata]